MDKTIYENILNSGVQRACTTQRLIAQYNTHLAILKQVIAVWPAVRATAPALNAIHHQALPQALREAGTRHA